MRASPAFTCLLAALLLSSSLAPLRAEEASRATIETTGESSISAPPDFAVIAVGVQSAAKAAQAALADNSKASATVIDALKKAGVEARDIQTSDFSIWPQASTASRSGVEPPAIAGFVVSNQVKVTVRDLTKMGDLLDKAVASGANAIGGVQFGLANPSPLLDQARKAAFAEARRKAELYAAEAGVKIVGLVSLDETGGAGPVFAAPAALSAARTRIEPGESLLNVSVRARFEIAR